MINSRNSPSLENITRETRRELSPLNDGSKERVALANKKVQKKKRERKKRTHCVARVRQLSGRKFISSTKINLFFRLLLKIGVIGVQRRRLRNFRLRRNA